MMISPVISQADKKAFYKLAWRIYKNDPNWVPPLWPQRKGYLDKQTAFFTHGEGEFWLAKIGEEVVGSIGTAVDASRNQSSGVKSANFGFFEVLPGGVLEGYDDEAAYDVARQMWDHACQWGSARGMTELHGPYSFGANDESGFLVDGFDTPTNVFLAYNHRLYPTFAERYGFVKEQDMLAYRYDFSTIDNDVNNGPEIVLRIAERVRQRHTGAIIRNPRMENWDREIEILHKVYNTSLAVLPEHTHLELSDFREVANSLKPIIDPELVFIAEVNGEAVGFALGLPNIMEAFAHYNGLQYPWDYLRFALGRRKITSASFKILAIEPDYWGWGLETLMIVEIGKALIRKGYTWADGSLTGEDNPQTHKIATRLGAYPYRRYRVYKIKI